MIIVWIPAAQIIATYLPRKVREIRVFGEPVLYNSHDHETTAHDETETGHEQGYASETYYAQDRGSAPNASVGAGEGKIKTTMSVTMSRTSKLVL